MYTFMLSCCCSASPFTPSCVLVRLLCGSANAAFLAKQTPELVALPWQQLSVCPAGRHVGTPSVNLLGWQGQLSVETMLTDERFQAVLAVSMKL